MLCYTMYHRARWCTCRSIALFSALSKETNPAFVLQIWTQVSGLERASSARWPCAAVNQQISHLIVKLLMDSDLLLRPLIEGPALGRQQGQQRQALGRIWLTDTYCICFRPTLNNQNPMSNPAAKPHLDRQTSSTSSVSDFKGQTRNT